MKTILVAVVGTVGLLTTPAVAGKPKKKQPLPQLKDRAAKKPAAKMEMPVLDLGDDFDLGPRRAAQPKNEETDQIKPRSLSELQVSLVVNKRIGDVQHCWNKLPQAQRLEACTAMIKLSISDAGAVTAVELGGDVPAGAHKCITSAVSRWSFPATEVASEIEYGISLRSL
jgi:hypothetical protein